MWVMVWVMVKQVRGAEVRRAVRLDYIFEEVLSTVWSVNDLQLR